MIASNADRWSVLRHRDFSLVCFARFFVTLAFHITYVAIGWYVYDVTGSAFALAYLGLAGFVPAVALVLVTGYVSDRYDRRMVMFLSDLVLAITSVALLWLVAGGGGVVWPVYLIVVIVSCSRQFHNPAAQAIIPALVPPAQLSSAIAFASSMFQGGQIVGPALGGILYAVDPRAPFIAAGLLYTVSALASIAVRSRQAPAAGPGKAKVTFESLMAGFSFALQKRVIFGAVALDAAVVLLGGVTVLLPIFAKDILEVGALGLGFLRAAPAVGAVLMALWLANNDYVKRGTGRKLFATIAVYGLAVAAFGLSASFWLSLVLLVVVGASDMISVVIRHTMVQAETPDDLRGRVAAVNSLFISSSSEMSQARAGFMAGMIGASWAVVIGGLMAASLAWVWPRLFPGLAARDHLVEEPGSSGDKREGAKA
jgi:MFS family permease